jgi:hypothetical protein
LSKAKACGDHDRAIRAQIELKDLFVARQKRTLDMNLCAVQ